MFCKNCGSALKDGSRFCQFCGTPVTIIPNSKPTVTPPDATEEENILPVTEQAQEPVQEVASETVQEAASETVQEDVSETVQETVTEDTDTVTSESETDDVLDELIREDEEASESVPESVEEIGQSALPAAGENTAYDAPAPAAVPFTYGAPKPEPPKTPFRRALVKVASSPLFLAFAIVLIIAAAGQLTGVVSFVKINGVNVRANINLFPTLSAALGIVTAIALFKLHSAAKKNSDVQSVLGGANAYVIYKEVCSWLVFALMIILIIAVALMLVATLASNGIIKEIMNSINWTEGLDFRESFEELLDTDAINAIYREVPYIDDVWQAALSGIYTFTTAVGLNAPADFLYLLYIVEIVALIVIAISAAGSVLSAVYFIKLRKYVSRVRYSWKTDAPFTNKSGFISFFSVVFAAYYTTEALTSLFTSPLRAIASGASAAAFIMLMLILRKFKAAMAEENSFSVSEQSEQ